MVNDEWLELRKSLDTAFVDRIELKRYISRPMSITWSLENEIPAKYIKQVRKLVVS